MKWNHYLAKSGQLRQRLAIFLTCLLSVSDLIGVGSASICFQDDVWFLTLGVLAFTPEILLYSYFQFSSTSFNFLRTTQTSMKSIPRTVCFLSVLKHTLEPLAFSLPSSQTTIIFNWSPFYLKPKQLAESVKKQKSQADCLALGSHWFNSASFKAISFKHPGFSLNSGSFQLLSILSGKYF